MADAVTVFEFAAFVAGAAVGALAARLLGLLPCTADLIDMLWRNPR